MSLLNNAVIDYMHPLCHLIRAMCCTNYINRNTVVLTKKSVGKDADAILEGSKYSWPFKKFLSECHFRMAFVLFLSCFSARMTFVLSKIHSSTVLIMR